MITPLTLAYRRWQCRHHRHWSSWLTKPVSTLPLMAVDLELTGLSTHENHIVSIGSVSMDHGAISLASARHQLVASPQGVGQSATIHGIVDEALNRAPHLSEALPRWWPEFAASVPVFHNASLDLGFLRCASVKFELTAPSRFAIDTMAIELNRLRRQGRVISSDDLRLERCRGRYGLPSYVGHNALSDAIATAELLLAQLAYLDDDPPLYQILTSC